MKELNPRDFRFGDKGKKKRALTRAQVQAVIDRRREEFVVLMEKVMKKGGD